LPQEWGNLALLREWGIVMVVLLDGYPG
jgi:hypothetical protein